jgi:hypothetical protein
MAIEAPVSKFKRNNQRIYAIVCIVFAAIFAYDGYLSKYEWSQRRSFYDKHAPQGKLDDTMRFNQIAPIFLAAAAAGFAWRFRTLKGRRVLVTDDGLVIDDKERIYYDSIQKIDKTYFESKGFFIVTYKNSNGAEVSRKISDGDYDNLVPVLDHLVAKIS